MTYKEISRCAFLVLKLKKKVEKIEKFAFVQKARTWQMTILVKDISEIKKSILK